MIAIAMMAMMTWMSLHKSKHDHQKSQMNILLKEKEKCECLLVSNFNTHF